MDFPSGHHPFASGQHHFASGENNCKKFFAIPQYPHPYIIFWQIKTPDFIFQLLSIISHPFGFILQQTPIQNYIFVIDIYKMNIEMRAGKLLRSRQMSQHLIFMCDFSKFFKNPFFPFQWADFDHPKAQNHIFVHVE